MALMLGTPPMIVVGELAIDRQQREAWIASKGAAAQLWRQRYPDLFDEADERLSSSQPEAHFYEWLAAIFLHHTSGYLALVEKYVYKNNRRKLELARQLLPPAVLAFLQRDLRGTQPPDLLMYAPDMSDWFFCEVKGATDRLRPSQSEFFAELAALSGRPVRVLHFYDGNRKRTSLPISRGESARLTRACSGLRPAGTLE